MAGLDLSNKVGTKTKKGTLITQAHASAVAADNAYIEIVQDNSHLIAQMIPTAIAKALEEVGLLAEGHVIGYMTAEYIVDTGRLRNSITHAITDGMSVVIGTNVSYAKYVHNGTSKVAARPFLTAPIKQHLQEYKQMIKAAMGNA